MERQVTEVGEENQFYFLRQPAMEPWGNSSILLYLVVHRASSKI